MSNEKKLKLPNEQAAQQSQTYQYKTPTDIVELPSKGKFYPEGHPFQNVEEVEIHFMTTKEEDILTSSAYSKRGSTFDKLVESLLVKKVKASTLLPGDKSAILINARKNAYSPEYAIKVLCEICDTPGELTVDLDEVGVKEVDYENYEFTDNGAFIMQLPRTKATVEIKILSSEDEDEIVKKAEQKAKHNLPETAATDRLRQMVISVNDNRDMMAINDFVMRLPIADSKYIKDVYIKLNPDIDFTYEHECEKCGYANKGVVPILGNFFWPDI